MWLMLVFGPAHAQTPPNLTEAVLEVALSDKDPGEMLIVLRGPDGELYLDEKDFAALRLRLPETEPVIHEGKRFFDPRAIKGCTVKIDESAQRAVINVPASVLDTTRLSAAERRSPP